MATQVKTIVSTIQDQSTIKLPWNGHVIVNEDNLTYLAFNEAHREAIFVDPMMEDLATLEKLAKDLKGYRFVGVFDTHTHADHISCGPELAQTLSCSFILHHLSPSKRIQIRISNDAIFATSSGPLQVFTTPGHTPDSLCIQWGPFIFTGDMIFFNDVGRDDLPGGDGGAHWESIEKMKGVFSHEGLVLPGHDGVGGRSATWGSQLKTNSNLSMNKATFIKECGEWTGPSPKNLKESLFYNFK